MATEDNFANDEDYFSTCSEGVYDSEDDGEEDNYNFDSGDEDVTLRQSYSVLGGSEINISIEDTINRLCTLLFISRDCAISLLLFYKWRVGVIHEEWFADEEKVREAVGLLENPVVEYSERKEKLNCPICLEIFSVDTMKSAACGHLFCDVCWAGYVRTAINDGPGCLRLHCAFPDCKAAVTQDMIQSLASDEEKEKHFRYFQRSFVEDGKNTKWCPAPDCEFAVKFDGGSENYDVCCGCSYSFCWNCTQESHRPLDCGAVAQWLLKNSSESENVTWILANSKQCPKCNRPIQKNKGCMHMVCSEPCKFHFCWLCLGPWSEHGEKTGGFYACNKYEESKQSGKLNEQERQKEMAKNSLERYMHYYERWASNQKSQDKAATDLKRMQLKHIKKLIDTQRQPEAQLNFIIEAWEQIMECRRFLKWTYAYGYYLPQDQLAKKQFFEYLQGEAESGLEKLHQCAETELETYILAEDPRDDFSDFRSKLAGLTGVTKSFFKNLAQALENGLEDVESHT